MIDASNRVQVAVDTGASARPDPETAWLRSSQGEGSLLQIHCAAFHGCR